MADNGSGQYGGNGSVYHRHVHSANLNPGRAARRWNGNGQKPNVRDWVKVGDQQETEIIGHDGVHVDDVGVPGHKGRFRITARYSTRPAGATGAAIAGAVAAVPAGTTSANLAGLDPSVTREALRAVAIQELTDLIASATQARTQLQNAPAGKDIDVAVVFYVPVISRPDPPAPADFEVTVDW